MDLLCLLGQLLVERENTMGHMPREISKVVWFFLRQRPCTYTFIGKPRTTVKTAIATSSQKKKQKGWHFKVTTTPKDSMNLIECKAGL